MLFFIRKRVSGNLWYKHQKNDTNGKRIVEKQKLAREERREYHVDEANVKIMQKQANKKIMQKQANVKIMRLTQT